MWGNVFEYFKERRYAAVFFGTLMATGGALVVGGLAWKIILDYNWQDDAIYVAPFAGLIPVLLILRAIAQARARRRERYKISPMSRDELNKARSKLLKY
jgi:hypothetical protein